MIDLPAFIVPRPHLVERIDRAAQGRFTAVVAPPGFGKSILLRQWAADPGSTRIGLLRLDRQDNDGQRLASRLIGALSDIDPDIGLSAMESADRSGQSLGDRYLAQLLEDLELSAPGVLVIDELDMLTNPRLVLDLRSLVALAPASLNVVVAMRSDPEHPWSNETASRLDHVDLAFSAEHAGTLLARLSNRELTASQIEAVMAKTEGWPAALQLIGLALREGADVDDFVERLSGAEQFIGAYLTNEVLGRQPEEIRHFLLQTSVLRRLSGPLCDAVIGQASGHELLAAVEHRSMFLVRIDEVGTWFRYHRLFQDLTRHELRVHTPEVEADLLRAAADWHLAEGEVDAAVGYLIEAREWDRVLELVTKESRRLFELSEAQVVLRWLGEVPAVLRSERRDLQLIEAILHTMVGSTVEGQAVVEDLERSQEVTDGELAVLNTLRSVWVQHHSTPEAAIAAADTVLRMLDEDPQLVPPDPLGLTGRDHLRYISLVSRARAYCYQRATDRARTELTDLLEGELAYEPWRISALGALALVDLWDGRLHRAHDSAARAMVLASRADLIGHPSSAEALLVLGAVARERGQTGRAELYLDQALAPAARLQRSVVLGMHAVERATLDLVVGDPERGVERILAFLASGQWRLPQLVANRLRIVEARLRLATGDLASTLLAMEAPDWPRTAASAPLAVQAAVRSGDVDLARRFLADWPSTAVEAEVALWTAVVEDLSGDHDSARRAMTEALSLAEADGHVRLFIDAGPEAIALLRAVATTHPTPYLLRILEHDPASAGATRNPLGLSPRELVILRYLPSQLSNAELAAQLYVSQNTLKTHLRSIYRRLEVSGRRDAVAAAERLGLV